MGQLDKDGILTLQELMITALATADVVAKLLIDKGLVSQKEYDLKLFSERASYQALLQRVGEGPSISNVTHYNEFHDWDSHAFHFVDGMPKNADASLAMFTPKEQDKYLQEWRRRCKKLCSRSLSKRLPPATRKQPLARVRPNYANG